MNKVAEAVKRALERQCDRTPDELFRALEHADETLAYGMVPSFTSKREESTGES